MLRDSRDDVLGLLVESVPMIISRVLSPAFYLLSIDVFLKLRCQLVLQHRFGVFWINELVVFVMFNPVAGAMNQRMDKNHDCRDQGYGEYCGNSCVHLSNLFR